MWQVARIDQPGLKDGIPDRPLNHRFMQMIQSHRCRLDLAFLIQNPLDARGENHRSIGRNLEGGNAPSTLCRWFFPLETAAGEFGEDFPQAPARVARQTYGGFVDVVVENNGDPHRSIVLLSGRTYNAYGITTKSNRSGGKSR